VARHALPTVFADREQAEAGGLISYGASRVDAYRQAGEPSGAKFKMVFTADGKMTREPLEKSGNGSAGTWKLNAKGFCTAWNHAKPNCFTVVPSGENKWSVQKIATTIATTVAVWSK
jgi:hypothetical protein